MLEASSLTLPSSWRKLPFTRHGTFDLRHQAKAAPNLPAFIAFMLIVLQIDWAENMGEKVKNKF